VNASARREGSTLPRTTVRLGLIARRRRHARRLAIVANPATWLARCLAVLLILPFFVWGANTAALSVADAILNLGWAAATLALLPSTTAQFRRMAPVLLPLGLFLAWAILPLWPPASAGLVAPAVAPDLLPIAWCHAASLVALLVACGLAGGVRGFVRVTTVWLCLGAALLMATTLGLRAFGGPDLVTGMIAETGYHRFTGLIGNANAAGISFGMISLLMRGTALDRWRAWRQRVSSQPPLGALLAVIGLIVAMALVTLSQSRTALAATVGAHLIYGIHRGRTADRGVRNPAKTTWRILSAAALVSAGVALLLFGGAVLDRYRVAPDDGRGRFAVLEHFAGLAAKAPPGGYGLGAFDAVNQRSLTPDTVLMVGDFGAAHNVVLQLVIEVGWPGLALIAVAMVAMLVPVVRRLFRSVRTNPLRRAILLMVAVAIAGGMVDIALNVPAIATLCAALLGLIWGQSLRTASFAAMPDRTSVHPTPWSTAAIRS